jgi:hypothetical protein
VKGDQGPLRVGLLEAQLEPHHEVDPCGRSLSARVPPGAAALAPTPYDPSRSVTSLVSSSGMSRTSACSRRHSLA